MLLIMGLGEQLIARPDGFCALFAGHGFRVIRFDNRDIGLSTWLDELGDVDLAGLLAELRDQREDPKARHDALHAEVEEMRAEITRLLRTVTKVGSGTDLVMPGDYV